MNDKRIKAKYLGKSSPLYCINGKVYNVIGKQCGYWRVVDEMEDDYLYSPNVFEVVEGNPDDLEEALLEE